MSEPRPTYCVRPNELTPRQLEVLIGVCQGKINKQIAAELCCSERTIKAHVMALFEKMRVTNRVQALIWAIQHGHYSVTPLPSVAQRERTEAAGLQPAGSGD